jgi:hypothetical protein
LFPCSLLEDISCRLKFVEVLDETFVDQGCVLG